MKDNQLAKQSFYARGIEAFEGLQPREQNLLFVIIPCTIVAVFILLLIEPEIKKTQALEKSAVRLQSQLAMGRQSNEELMAQALIDPNDATREQIVNLRNMLNLLNAEFESELNQLISPQAMPVLLEQLFDQADNLTLNNMKSVAPQMLITDSVEPGDESTANASTSSQQPIYRHGIEISFEGSFFATREFLSQAESLGWKLYWQDLSYVVGDHPNAVTTMTLFTLSTSEAFIGVN
jgi:MSHA biogenesis protein MshJ